MAEDHPNSTSGLHADDIAGRAFGIVRRGFDPQEVRAYLEVVAKALERATLREQELLDQVQAAEDRARHPVIDESVLTSSLGKRSAAVLRGAHEEAARILSQAEGAATATLRDAQHQANEAQVNAESSAAERIAEAELEANSLRHQAREQAAAVVETARVEGEALVERARDQGKAMLDQAQEARRRIIADMAQRRRLMAAQIELFRTARDEIAGSIMGVRRSLDRVVEDLSHAEDAARESVAARPRVADASESLLVEEGERVVAELGDLESEHRPSAQHAVTLGADQTERATGAVLRFDDIATIVEPREESGGEEAREEANGGEAEGDGEGDADAGDAEGDGEGDADAGDADAGDAPVHDWQDDPVLATRDAGTSSSGDEPVPVGGARADPPTGGSDADGLFARLRAHRMADHAYGGGDFAEESADALRAADAVHAAVYAVAEPDAWPATGEEAHAEERSLEVEGEDAPSPDAPAFARRSEALGPIVTTLSRRLKRALQDDQNRLLDRLRQGTGEWRDELLLDETSQKSLYANAATTPVGDAMSAGIAFARAVGGGRQSKSTTPDQRIVEAVAGELAASVVTLIRRRLEGGEAPDASERIGAAYREWRGERIERLAADSAVEAFSKGVLAGAGKRDLRWSRNQDGPGCADCEDNALAGAVSGGSEFPTGHLHPPAHAGCRCLIVPTPS